MAAATLVLPFVVACAEAPPDPVEAADPAEERPEIPTLAEELSPAAAEWVETTLAGMTLAEKAAQLVAVRAFGLHQHPESDSYQRLLSEIADLKVGGVVVFRSEVDSVPHLLNRLQRAAEVPLLISADLERSLSFRIRQGTVPLPSAMAIGATRSEAAAKLAGEITAREGRALGIHWALAPVADVNSDPANPVINLRSFGEDPELVARLAAAFVRGARRGGILTSAKHFPGHGDTSTDSHFVRPVVHADRERLEALEWVPFRRLIEAGVDSVMTAHVAVPAIDPTGAPATLSPILSGEALRNELGYTGLIVTDALEMAGIRPAWTGEAVVRAVEAGADVLLLPNEPGVAVSSLVRAVREGQLTAERIEASTRRVLETKARLGLHQQRLVDAEAAGDSVARPEDVARAVEIAGQAITLVRNDGDVLPLHGERPLRLVHVELVSDPRSTDVWGALEGELAARGLSGPTYRFGPEISETTQSQLLQAARNATHVLISSAVRVNPAAGQPDLAPGQARLLRRLTGTGVPVILVSYGSPYLLAELPEVPVYLNAYGTAESSQRAVVSALFGEISIVGKLPVTLPDHFPFGHGLELARRPMSLVAAPPEAAGFRPNAMDEVDAVVERFVAERAFPGGVVAVGRAGRLVHLRPFGRLAYTENAPAVTSETLYDLASLTKVIATTTMAMILVDEGRLDLDKAVRDFLPRFAGTGKERVTVRHLLTHSSGVDWWAPLYEELEGQAAYVERIQAMELVYEPGSETRYSDLGIILLAEILERVAGQDLESFTRERLFAPLGMEQTMFRPPSELRRRIAPTEQDPWRGRGVHGEVHDENAFAMGGVAPHAGLFGTAGDLARFAQMILNGGIFEHRRIVSRPVVERFTRPAGIPADSTRALGWDTKSAEGSSAGTLFSPRSFGHTGFTGTSLWIDPERQLFVILLTNRVHPTRENNLIREARPAVADAVVRGLAER